MTGDAAPREAPPPLGGPGLLALRIWSLVVWLAWIVGPFLLAGTVAWASGWLHLVVVLGGGVAEARYVARRNPALAERRRHIGGGTQRWDLAWNVAFWPLMAAIALVAGLQTGRLGSTLPAGAWLAGLAVVGAGFWLSAWAMSLNPWFEGTVRIQAEAGHQVFAGGPYRHLRHPGYLGLGLWALGTCLLLRSTWAIPVGVAAAAWIVVRTALEDATLQRELPGYADYARRVRWRLLPHVW